jgi:hypothetical protein
MNSTMTHSNPAKRGRPIKRTELIRDGKCITVRFPPSIEREVASAAEQEGLLVAVWLRRLAVLELRRLRRGKSGS